MDGGAATTTTDSNNNTTMRGEQIFPGNESNETGGATAAVHVQGCDDPAEDWIAGPSPDPRGLPTVGAEGQNMPPTAADFGERAGAPSVVFGAIKGALTSH